MRMQKIDVVDYAGGGGGFGTSGWICDLLQLRTYASPYVCSGLA